MTFLYIIPLFMVAIITHKIINNHLDDPKPRTIPDDKLTSKMSNITYLLMVINVLSIYALLLLVCYSLPIQLR